MAGFSVTRRIDAPVDEVFAVFADFEHAAERIDGIKVLDVLTGGPIGVGSRFRETRVMFGKEATEEMEITAFERGRSYTVECTSHGSHYTSVYTFEPRHDGTDVTLSFDVEAISLFAKLMSPIAGTLVKAMQKLMVEDIDDLQRYLEASSGSGG